MKKLISSVLGLGLLASVASFAQDTGGCKHRAETGKKAVRTDAKSEKGHKGGKKGKGKKVTTDKMTTAPPSK